VKLPPRLRILADDLTGALDCASALGVGARVHLGRPESLACEGIDIVATASRDVRLAELPALLSPSLQWLKSADIPFKKVDSLLRGNTLDEVDWLARHAPFAGLALVPAFPAQQRITNGGRQLWRQPDGSLQPVAQAIDSGLRSRGWQVVCGAVPPVLPDGPVALVPDVADEAALDAIAALALKAGPRWLWCGSAGLAYALARQLPAVRATAQATASPPVDVAAPAIAARSPAMLVSASHHPVSRAQWQSLRTARLADCLSGEDPRCLVRAAPWPPLIDLAASAPLRAAQASALLREQAQAIATHAPRPRVLVVVGGDTLLALCQALGVHSLQSALALARPGWGCARLVGGLWDGLVCHTRSGAFGGPQDLIEVLSSV